MKTVLLGDEIELIGGGTPKTTNSAYWGGDIDWLSVVDFGGNSRWVKTAEKKITKEGLKNSSTKLLYPGDIIISARGTVGELAQLKVPMAFNQSCYGIRAKGNLDQDYLYYLLKLSISDLQRQAHGGVFSTITRETFQHIKVQLPQRTAQQQIANILGKIDEKIELNRRMNESLEQIGQALFKHSFIDNPEAKTWIKGRLSDFTEVITGKGSTKSVLAEGGKYPLYGAGGLMGTSDKYLLDDPVIITGRVGTLGKIQAVTGKAWFSDNVLIIKPKPSFFGFVYYLVRLVDFVSMNRGSSQPLVTQTDLKNHSVKTPDEKTIQEFESLFQALFCLIQKGEKEIITLGKLRDSLLPRLISGKIKV
jgi:type I restriction enzyme S subunit